MSKLSKVVILIISIICISVLAVSCSGDNRKIAEIKVDTLDPSYDLDTFDIGKLNLIVTFEAAADAEAETETIPMTTAMIKAEDRVKLKVAGEHIINVLYRQKTTSFTIRLEKIVMETHSVIFLSDDGTQIGSTQYVVDGSSASPPTVPAKENHDFSHWSDKDDNDTAISASYTVISKNTTFIAVYTQNYYVVKFSIDNVERTGSSSSGYNAEDKGWRISKGGSASSIAPSIPIKTGFSNGRWENDEGVSLSNITKNTTFVARYDEDTVLVTFHYGNNVTETASYPVNSQLSNMPSTTISNGVFCGWYINEYFEGVKAKFPYTILGETSFYAKYISYTSGTSGLHFSDSGDSTYTVSSYDGEESIIVIPARYNGLPVVGIDDGVFSQKKITQFIVSGDNQYFQTADGVLFNKSRSSLICFPSGKLDSIGAYVNQYYVPDIVERIENYAFAGASYLNAISFSDNTETNLKHIGNYAFKNCSGLNSFYVPKSVRTLGDGVLFTDVSSNLSSVTFSEEGLLESIGSYAFAGLSRLNNIILPVEELSEISGFVFNNCLSLSEISLFGNSNYFASVDGVLYSKDMECLIAYPSANNNQNLPIYEVRAKSTICSGAFSQPTLLGIKLSPTITTVESLAFDGKGLKFLQFFGNAPINFELNIFGEVSEALEIYVPEGKDYDGFLNSVVGINKENVIIGSPISNQFSYSQTAGEAQYLYGTDIDGKIVIYGYRNTRAVKELSIPSTIGGIAVSGIGPYAFYNDNILTKITLSEGITSVGEYAFSNMKLLNTLVLPRTIKSFGDSALAESTKLFDISFIPLAAGIAEEEAEPIVITSMGADVFLNTVWYEKSSDEYLTMANVLVKYNGFGISAVIPDGLTIIADNAFENKTALRSLTFNDTIAVIGEGAFFGCENLYYIELPETLVSIGTRAFDFCDGLVCIKIKAKNPPTIPTDGNVFSLANEDFVIEVPYSNSVTDSPLTKYKEASGWDYYSSALVSRIEYEVSYTPYEQSITEKVSVIYIEKIPEARQDDVFGGWYYLDTGDNPVYLTYPYHVTATQSFTAKWYPKNLGSNGLQYELINGGTEYAVTGYNGADTDIGKRVVVPSVYKDLPVTAIYRTAFSALTIETENNSEILSITIPEGVNYIEEQAFVDTEWYKDYLGDFVICGDVLIEYKGTDARKVIVPEGITYLSTGAFRNNPFIEEVQFPVGITSISAETMLGCVNLKTVILPETLVSIESKAFSGCTSLETLSFPQSIERISPDAFEDTAWINSFTSDFIRINNILYKYVGDSPILHIANGISRIEDEAFSSNVSLQNLFIPQSVLEIGKSVFEGCVNISTVEFSSGTMIRSIGDRAFFGCLGLRLITFEGSDNKLERIGAYAFYNTSSLVSMDFPSTLIELGEYAFSKSNVQKISFARNNGLVVMPIGAFSDCLNLHTVDFASGSMLEYMYRDAFKNCQLLKSIVFAATKLVSIDVDAFYDCRSLSEVSLPNTLRSIADGAFDNTEYMRTQQNEMTIVGGVLLKYRGTETEVTIAKNIATISDAAFKDNLFIEKVVFEAGSQLSNIGSEAFYGCSRLTEITFPSTVSFVGSDAFTSTAWLENYVDDYVVINSVLVKYKGDDYQAVIPKTYNNTVVTTIASGAFTSRKLMNVVVGEGVTTIKEKAFVGVNENMTLTMMGTNPPKLEANPALVSKVYVYSEAAVNAYTESMEWNFFGTNISKIVEYLLSFDTLNPSMEVEISIDAMSLDCLYNEPLPSVYGYSFVGWYQTYSPDEIADADKYKDPITLPFVLSEDTTVYAKWVSNDVGTTIQQIFTDSASNIMALYNESNKPAIANTYSDYVSESGSFIYGYAGSDRLVMMPKECGGNEIVGIGAEGFANRADVEEIYFVNNSTIKYILDGAFANCTKLRKIVLPAGITYIGKNAFEGCASLEEIIFTDSSDMEIELRIGERAFRDCSSLESITLSGNVVYIGENAFEGCDALSEITLKRNVQNNITNDTITNIDEDGIFGESAGYLGHEIKIFVPYSASGSARSLYLNSNWDRYSDYIVQLSD